MYKVLDEYIFSPSDLTAFLESDFVTWMDRFYLESPGWVTPDAVDEETELVLQKGISHEKAYLQSLSAQGIDVFDAAQSEDSLAATFNAVQAGREVIYQALLYKAPFKGYADFLFRVDTPSSLGNFSYEVGDTKLSRKAKPTHIIQLCCYAEMLEKIQGIRPKYLRIILGNGIIKRFLTEDYFYYYLQVKEAFLAQQASFDPGNKPEPIYGDNFGRWSQHAEAYLNQTDHLSRVANITRTQIRRLEDAGIRTLTSLATTDVSHVVKMDPVILERLKQQARLQLDAQTGQKPVFHILPLLKDTSGKRIGFQLLPPASLNDIFFDMEGYPLVEGGLEYLFGATHLVNGKPMFQDWWAYNDAEEKRAFESFIDWAYARWKADPAMHIYHYASYEVTAMRKLMGKHGTREREVDALLTHEVFVDLYTIVRQSLMVGEPSYSIKYLEHFYMEAREGDVKNAGASIVYYEKWLKAQDGADWQTSKFLKDIRDYNKDDCDSTWKLTDWLRGIQSQSGVLWVPPNVKAHPDDDMQETSQEESAAALAQAMLAAIPEDHEEQDETWRLQKLLAYLLEFHRREKKPFWWSYFDRLCKTDLELVDDPDCLGLLTRTTKPPQDVQRSRLFEYRYNPDQETKLSVGDTCHFVIEGESVSTTIEAMDKRKGLVEIKLSRQALQKLGLLDADLPTCISLMPYDIQRYDTLEASIYRTVKTWWDTRVLPSALEDFLLRRRPRLLSGAEGPLIAEGDDTLAGTINVVLGLDNSTLCIQGPPGAGKSYTASYVILDLLKRGFTVGITSNSHKAIHNLMAKVAQEAEKLAFPFYGAKIGGEKDPTLTRFATLSHHKGIKEIKISPHDGFQLVGATAWGFSHEVAKGTLDYLFVDEAGQVSIANLVAMSPSTRNIVILGDQMQLGQPIQGSHPGESGQSILEYYLQDEATIPPDKGIFLGTTYRLHPDICAFISNAVYEGRLLSNEAETRKQTMVLPSTRSSAFSIQQTSGILFYPVPHDGNTQGSPEEADAISRIVRDVLACEYREANGSQRPLTMEDVLFVAPYNMQVRLLEERLGPGAKVGSVDKFQGQEAPVVIVSMCASNANESSRGLEFLLSKNRMNVAISRAKCLAIIVGSPSIALTRCSKINQMALLNLYCKILQCYSSVPAPKLLDNA